MEVSHILDDLNDAQREAVTAPEGNLLVLAGAGSGKTRVLVHRILWLIQVKNASPFGILAVTFTNKAAAEMRGRIESLLGLPLHNMWVGTFHGLTHRLLRRHWQEAGLSKSFQILDAEDQLRLIRRLQKQLNLDEEKWPPKQAQWFINHKKDEGLRPQHISSDHHIVTETLLKVYTVYEETCRRSELVDFAELLLRSHELWLTKPDLLMHYQQRFQHILVDEFQDTNTLQYAWLRVLAGGKIPLTGVGDDDQSIYGWRGARIENIHRFSRDFSDTKIVRLEQNYRSTSTILNAANAVISRNTNRLGKKLWTSSGQGEPITLYAAFNELDEARFIVEQIKIWVRQGNKRNDIAILYRSNAQSRVLEEALIREGIPYRVYGGLRFFERIEIKDALAYLRLIANRHDDAAFERVVNTPTRGIGHTTLNIVRDCAREKHMSLWLAANDVIAANILPSRAANTLSTFLLLINQADIDTQSLILSEQTEHILQVSGLRAHFSKDKSERGNARLENLDELVNATNEFAPEDQGGITPLAAFLSQAALETGETQAGLYEDCVQLMTLHLAKGLEFPLVFLAGVEEGLFPHKMSIKDDTVEEERRLCYVGMTRAMQKLYMSYAETRRLYGNEMYCRPSRFIEELPKECLQEWRITKPMGLLSKQNSSSSFKIETSTVTGTGLNVGQRVKHKKFGEGVVINYEGQSAHARVQVKFEYQGTKWLIASYANLEAI